MGRTQVFDWFRRFKEGRTSVESDPCSGRPSTSRTEEMIAKIRRIVRNKRRLTVREIADDCGISVGSCDAILTDDLHMKRMCAKIVPRLLTDDQRQQRQSPVICLSVHVKTCSFLKKLWEVTSPGSTGTSQRQNSNRHSGRVPLLRDQRSGARCEAKQRSSYWRFLILRVSFTTSTLPTGKELKGNSTWRSCDVCVNQFAEKTGKMAGWQLDPAPRQCARTHFTSCAAVFGQTRHRSSRHTHQISHRLTFSYSQGLSKFWKDTDLRQRRASNEFRRRHY